MQEAFFSNLLENNFLGNKHVACFDANVQTICRDYTSPSPLEEPFPLESGDMRDFFYEEDRN